VGILVPERFREWHLAHRTGYLDELKPRPIAECGIVVLAPTAYAMKTTSGRRGLVDDDERLNLKLASFRMKQAGYELETASGGAEGLALARPRTPDAILTDVSMPSMDGFAFCRRPAEIPPWPPSRPC
jgi:hypothetical protein